jgi:hypothetical protein
MEVCSVFRTKALNQIVLGLFRGRKNIFLSVFHGGQAEDFHVLPSRI